MDKEIKWQISVPIFKQSLILKQLAIAIGIPFGTLILVLIIISKKEIYIVYAVGMIVTPLILTWLFFIVVYKGKYQVEFIIDQKGIHSQMQTKQEKKNKGVNRTTVLLGVLTGKPTVTGAGMLAQSRQKVFIPWEKITKLKFDEKGRTILVKTGMLEPIALFCTKDNYAKVKAYVERKKPELSSSLLESE